MHADLFIFSILVTVYFVKKNQNLKMHDVSAAIVCPAICIMKKAGMCSKSMK